MQICNKCGEAKPDERFGFQTMKGKKYRMHRCKDCVNEGQRRRYSPEKQRGYRATRYVKDPDYKAKHHLNHNYGITLAQYEAILTNQGGVCAICGSDKPGNRATAPRFHVDHCHSTGRIRGLICGNCNAGVGRFKDDPCILERAASYIRWSDTGLRAKRTYRYGRQAGYITHE